MTLLEQSDPFCIKEVIDLGDSKVRLEIKCNLCGKSINEINGYFARVNEKGIPGVWECRPSCDAKLSFEESFIKAIENEKP